jgi:hypothetical protein
MKAAMVSVTIVLLGLSAAPTTPQLVCATTARHQYDDIIAGRTPLAQAQVTIDRACQGVPDKARIHIVNNELSDAMARWVERTGWHA